MSSSQPKTSLDNLMMAYTDLSGTSKSAGFKGPAMKDVKVDKKVMSSYQPSSKARDWSSLSQNLEDVFGPPLQSASSSSIVAPQSAASADLDDWGDFQGSFSNPQPTPVSTAPIVMNSTIPKPVLPMPSVPSSPFQAPMSQSTVVDDDDDDFADFVSAPTSTQSTKDVFGGSRPTPGVIVNPLSSQLSNLSLTSPPTVQNQSPKSLFDNFTFPSDLPKSPPPPQVTSPRSDMMLPLPSLAPSNPQKGQPKSLLDNSPVKASNPLTFDLLQPAKGGLSNDDKYSNLRDVFDLEPVKAEVSTVTQQETYSLPPALAAYEAAAASKAPAKTEVVNETADEDDDFGDFVEAAAVTKSNPPLNAGPSSLPLPVTNSLSNDLFEMSQEPPKFPVASLSPSNLAPWMAEEPPEMTFDTSGTDHADLDHKLGGAISDLNVLTDLDMGPVASPVPQFVPPPDNLSVSPGEAGLDHTSQPRKGSAHSLHLSEEDEVSKTCSGGEDNQVGRSSPDTIVKAWEKTLIKVRDIMIHADTSIRQVKDFGALNEIFETDLGSSYLKNLHEVNRLFRRIKLASDRVGSQEVLRLCEEVEKAWMSFLCHARCPNRTLKSVETSELESIKCGLCLCDLNMGMDDGMNNESLCDQMPGHKYHSACANFWVNCVDPALPGLSFH